MELSEKYEKVVNETFNDSQIKQGAKELVKRRLSQCGWNDEVRELCRNYLKETNMNNQKKLIEYITPKARQLVPDSVKKELLTTIKEGLMEEF